MPLKSFGRITFNKRGEDMDINHVAVQSLERSRFMTALEMLEHLKHMSNPERLTVIETATRLIREDLTGPMGNAREEKNRRLSAAAMALKALYEPGGELAEWTSLDAEEFVDDYAPSRGSTQDSTRSLIS
jgi:hypothetical protein